MTIRKKTNFLLIGIFMSIGILGVLVSVIFAEKLVSKFKGGYPVYVRFNNLDGLVPGSKVIVGSGKTIGQIDEIELDGSVLVVTAYIEKKYKINSDATFKVLSTSFVGGKYLSVENYTGVAPYIASGTTLNGVDPVTINSILGMFTDAFASGSEEGVATGVTGIVASASEAVSEVNFLIKDNTTNINEAIANLTAASKNINALSANLNRKLNTISDKEFDQMVTDVSKNLAHLESFLNDINSDNAPLSVLKDPNITHSIRTIVTNLEETTQRVKAKPSLLLRS